MNLFDELFGSAPTKPKVTNIAAVCLVFRAKNPAEIFLETKDDTHPIKLARKSLCIIGGNWIGPDAKADGGPFGTVKREWSEELSLRKTVVHGSELKDLGLGGDGKSTVVEQRGTDDDAKQLDDIRRAIIERMSPFGSFTMAITRKAILTADPDYTKQGFTALVNMWTSPLDEEQWQTLAAMQNKHGNLLTEFATSTFTSLGKILEQSTRSAFGYDRVLQKFFGAMGLKGAHAIPCVPYIEVEELGAPLVSYEELLTKYDVEKKP